MKVKFFLVPLLLILLAMFFVACGGNADEYIYEPQQVSLDISDTDRSVPLAFRDTDNASFPVLHINSYYDPFIQERNFWHDGTISLSGVSSEIDFDDTAIRIRGRGNSTWWRGPDKRPLRFRFREARPVLSDNPARDWILLANQFDRSLLRNYAAFTLGGKLQGLDFTPVPHHVQLYVNGEYMGVYLLTDERNAEPGRMSIYWDEDPTISDYFLELDARAYQSGILDETFISVSGLYYDLRYPDDLSNEHVEYIRAYLEAVSYAIRRQSFDEILELIDLDSFVDFYIVQEFFKDIDARDLSVFMYISGTGDERRLFMGPIWDFDISAGNAANQPLGYGPDGLYVAEFNYWYRNLMRRPEFFEAVQTRWNEIRDIEIAQTIEHLHIVSVRYQDEFERNFERHPDVFGRAQMRTPQEILEIDYFMGHVEHLLNWLTARANWFDEFFEGGMAFQDHLSAYIKMRQEHVINVVVEGELYDFAINPISFHHRVMIPLSELDGVLAALHDADVTVTHNDYDLFVVIGNESFEFSIPTALPVLDDIFIPIRLIAEVFGHELDWNGTTNTVYITVSQVE